jgi:hypothetical protein
MEHVIHGEYIEGGIFKGDVRRITVLKFDLVLNAFNASILKGAGGGVLAYFFGNIDASDMSFSEEFG